MQWEQTVNCPAAGCQLCDAARRTLLLQLEEERKKLVEAINVTFGHLGQVRTLVRTRLASCSCAVSHTVHREWHDGVHLTDRG